MPKSIFIDPKEVRKPQILKIKDIPINQYKPDIKKETKKYGEEKLLKIYYDMLIIREFESMLNSIKIQGSYEGIECKHSGPAHLSIGQESSAVGQCVYLDIEDFIFGSHRSHGEVLAKCLSAIDELDENTLLEIMQSYMDGACLKVVEKEHKGKIKSLAQDFVLYGVLAEIFGRANGFNKGLGGSMHVFFAPFGSMPNNAIVGGAADISVGAALFKRINRKPGMVICNIGDGSMGCGPVWEAMMLAAMDQYHTLWDKKLGGVPPILFNFFNNFYGMGGQTSGETMGYQILARVGAGVNPENLHAERVDGYNPLAVADAIKRKKNILLQGNGPVLLDTITYRISGHSPSDASSYRSKVDALKQEVILRITKALKLAASLEISPRVKADFIESVMFSNQYKDKMEERTPEVLIPKEDNLRVKSISHKYRFALDENGKAHPKVKVFTYRDALFEAMLYRFYEDPTMVAYGEENRDWGGAFAVYRGLTEALPYHRLFNSPISEASIVGTAIGYAMCGGRVIPEIMYCDFLGRCGDEVFNQLPKWHAMSGNVIKMPVVLRVSVGSKYGAQHSQDCTALTAQIPGLKVVFPATPYDAKGLMNAALQGTDPVIFFESQRLYDMGEQFHKGGVPEGYYEIAIGEPDIKREGKDVTILTIGATLYRALEAADILQEKYGMSAEVIDARSLSPFNYEPVLASVKKTGRIVISGDASSRGSFMKEMAQTISELAFDDLDAPPVVVGSRNWITPAYELEDSFFPCAEWMIDAIHEKIVPLKGHVVKNNFTSAEQIRRNKLGV